MLYFLLGIFVVLSLLNIYVSLICYKDFLDTKNDIEKHKERLQDIISIYEKLKKKGVNYEDEIFFRATK